MADDDPELALRLNSLDRFRKRSSRLLLEEYSHCEVPAGCGGVVLRFVDAGLGLAARLDIVVVGDHPADAWIDGLAVESSRIRLEPGPHTLAIALRELGGWVEPTLVFVELQRELVPGTEQQRLTSSSAPDRWWVSPGPVVGEAWLGSSFEDPRWPLVRPDAAQLGPTVDLDWEVRGLLGRGVHPLAIWPASVHDGRAWIRHRFDVETPLELVEARG